VPGGAIGVQRTGPEGAESEDIERKAASGGKVANNRGGGEEEAMGHTLTPSHDQMPIRLPDNQSQRDESLGRY
jgi:hypothetical protein